MCYPGYDWTLLSKIPVTSILLIITLIRNPAAQYKQAGRMAEYCNGQPGHNEYLKGNFGNTSLKRDITIAARYNNPEYAAKSLFGLPIYILQNNI